MKKLFASLFGVSLFLAPVAAFADASNPLEPTPLQLAARVAALDAITTAAQDGQSLDCAMLFSATSTPVGQPVILAWGSVGAVEQTADPLNMRPTNGAASLTFETPGNWTYAFKFYDANGTDVSCTAKITVLQ